MDAEEEEFNAEKQPQQVTTVRLPVEQWAIALANTASESSSSSSTGIEARILVLEEVAKTLRAGVLELGNNPFAPTNNLDVFINDGLLKCSRSLQTRLATAAMAVIPLLAHSCLILLFSPSSGSGSGSASGSGSRQIHSQSSLLLKDLLHNCLPTLVERMGDAKEKIREAAQLALIDLYTEIHGAASNITNNSTTTTTSSTVSNLMNNLLNILDKEVKVNAFGHKGFRGREMSVGWLVACFETLSAGGGQFPWKSYLPCLIKLLEDNNDTVRNVSTEAVITLCNSSYTSKQFKAEVKKELVKAGVRQAKCDQIAAAILIDHTGDHQSRQSSIKKMSSVASLASTSSSLSTSGGNVSSNKPSSASSSSSTAVATAQTLSASGGSAAPEPDPIQFSSARELELELASILTLFKGKETEQNWEAREQAFQKLRGVFRGLNVDGNVMMLDSFVSANGIVRELHEVLVKSMHSLRTAIVVTTCSTIVDLATHTGKRLGLDTIMSESLLSNLIKVASQTKKICCSAAQSALAAVLKYTSYHPVRVLHTLFASLGEKNLNTRVCAITCIQIIAEIGSGMFRVTSLNGGSSTEFRDGLDPNGMDVLEKSLKKGLVDASAAVRDISRETFLLYEMMWPEKGLSLIDSLDPSAKKIIQRRKTSGSGPPVTFSSREQLALALSSAEPTPLKKVTPKTSRLSLRPQSSSSSLLSSTSSASDSAVSSTPQQRRLSRQASAMSGVSSNRNTTGNNGSSTNSSPSDTTFEDGILDLLKSLDSAKHFEGLQALSQAATLGKISACNRGYMLERLADVLPSVILGSGNNNSVSNPALITLFLDVSFLDAILAANLVTREVILSCLFNLMIDKQGGGSGANNNNNEHPSSISRKCAAYVDHLKATLSKPLLLDSLIKTLTEFKNTRAGGIAAARERERVWQETVLGLISDISSSEPGSQLDAELMDFFSGGGGEGSQRVRHLMLRMVPILERRTTNVLETTIYTLFSRLYRYNSALFRKTLNTFDIDTAEKVYERLGVSSTDCEVAASSIVSTLIPDIAMAAEPFRKENVVSAAEEFGRQSTLQFSADVASSAVDVGLLLEDETEPEDFADTSIMHSNAAPSTNTASTSGYNNVIHTNDKKMLMVDYDKDEEFVEGRQDNSPPSSISSQIQSNAINMLDFVSEWSTPVKKNVSSTPVSSTLRTLGASRSSSLSLNAQHSQFTPMSAESITINRPQVPSVYPPSSMASAVSNIDKVGKSFNTRLAGMEGFIGTPKNTSIIDHSLSRLRADGMTNRLFADSTPGAQQAKKSDYIDLMPKLLESIQSLSTSSSSPSSTSDSSSTLNIITRGGGGGLSASAIRKLVRISRDTSCWISGKSVGNSIGETKGGSSNSSPSSASRRYTLDKKDQSSAAAEHVKFADRIWSVWFHDTLAIILHALRQVGEHLKDFQENCLVLLTEMILNQTPYFCGYERDLFEVLVECRSDGSNEVSGGSEKALKTMIKHLRREACIVTVLEFLSANDLTAVQSVSGASNSPNSGGAGGARSSSASSSSMQKRIIDGRGGGNDTFSKSSLVLSSSASTTALLRPASYQPLPTRSAFEVLACLLKRWKDDVMMEKRVGNNVDYLNVVDDVDGLIESNSEVLSRVLEVCHRGLNSPVIDNRRGSVMAIVSLAQLLGEDRMWEFFSGHLTASQEKLVAVYIERSKRVSGGGGGGAVMNIANVATPQHFNSSASSSRVL